MSLYWIVAAILLPILGGALTPVLPFRSRKGMLLYLEALTLAASAIVLSLLAHGTTGTLHLVYFVRGLSISFRIDGLAMLFAGLVSGPLPCCIPLNIWSMRGMRKSSSCFTA